MSLDPYTSDSFNRGDGAIAGSTLDNAGGGAEVCTWATPEAGTWAISGNTAREALGNDSVLWIATIDEIDMRASIITVGAGEGPFARWSNAAGTNPGNGYLAFRNHISSVTQLFRCDGGSFTQLGSDGTTVTIGDKLGVQCVGDQISLLKNDVVIIGPITDGNYASGSAALYSGGEGTPHAFDSFELLVEPTAPPTPGYVMNRSTISHSGTRRR